MMVVAFFNATGQLLNKLASRTISLSVDGLLKNKYFIGGVTVFFLNALLYISLLPYGEVSVIYSLSALSYMWGMVLAKYILKENINIYKWAGVGLIITGVGIIGFLGW